MGQSHFPAGFRWGTATASYQIEGAVADDGRVPTIWDEFSHTPGRIVDGATGDVACDHFHRFAADLDLLAQLGVKAYRFSLAWGRLVDASGRTNPAGVAFYSRLVDGLLERGIDPVATLYHWDLPLYLDGGWQNRDTALRFGDYAAAASAALGDRIHCWTTLNEPWCSAFLGYGSGEHAPGHKNPSEALRAAHHLNLAHGLGVQALRANTKDTDISIVCNLHAIKAASDSPEDEAAAARLRRVANDIWTQPVLEGHYPEGLFDETGAYSDWSFVRDGDLTTIYQPIDSFGLNYYSSSTVAAAPLTLAEQMARGAAPSAWIADRVAFVPPAGPLTAMGWNIDPAALTDMLVQLGTRYPKLPLFVSENGAAFDDRVGPDGLVHDAARIDYLDRHLQAVADAIAAGVDVRGYFLWSLIDNFEWALGFTRRFGIVRVDYDTLARTPKDSFHWYAGYIADHS